jgi:hypothetical protein
MRVNAENVRTGIDRRAHHQKSNWRETRQLTSAAKGGPEAPRIRENVLLPGPRGTGRIAWAP